MTLNGLVSADWWGKVDLQQLYRKYIQVKYIEYDGCTTGTVKHKITPDFILDLYDQYKDLVEEQKEEEALALKATIDVLSKNMGDYLVLED